MTSYFSLLRTEGFLGLGAFHFKTSYVLADWDESVTAGGTSSKYPLISPKGTWVERDCVCPAFPAAASLCVLSSPDWENRRSSKYSKQRGYNARNLQEDFEANQGTIKQSRAE